MKGSYVVRNELAPSLSYRVKVDDTNEAINRATREAQKSRPFAEFLVEDSNYKVVFRIRGQAN